MIIKQEEINDFLNFLIEQNALDENSLNIKETIGVLINGNSMKPTAKEGDIAFVDRSQTMFQDDELYAIKWGNSIMVKRLEKMPKGCIRIISDNREDYPSKIIDLKEEQDFKIIGKAIFFIKKV